VLGHSNISRCLSEKGAKLILFPLEQMMLKYHIDCFLVYECDFCLIKFWLKGG